MPSRLTAFIHRGGWSTYRETLAKLHVLHRRRPGSVFLVPSHDEGVAGALCRFESTLVARAHNDDAPDRERGFAGLDSEPVSRALLIGATRGLAAAVAAKLAARFAPDQGVRGRVSHASTPSALPSCPATPAPRPLLLKPCQFPFHRQLTLILAGADETTLQECKEACEGTGAAVEAVAVRACVWLVKQEPATAPAAISSYGSAALQTDCTSAAVVSRLVEEEAVDVVVAVGAVDASSAIQAVPRVRAAAKACCAPLVDVRSFVVVNSALHCFGDGHCADTPMQEDAPLPPLSW